MRDGPNSKLQTPNSREASSSKLQNPQPGAALGDLGFGISLELGAGALELACPWSSSWLLFPTHHIVFVGAGLGVGGRIDHFVRPGGPDRHGGIRFEKWPASNGGCGLNQAVQPSISSSVRGVLRHLRSAIEGVPAFFVVVEIERNDVWVPPGVPIDSIRSEASHVVGIAH